MIIEGKIDSVRPPKLSSKNLRYFIFVKVNGKWKNIVRTKENKAIDVYEKILEQQREQSVNVDRKVTYLTNKQIKDCEIAIDKLIHHYGKDEVDQKRLMIESVKMFINRTPSLKCPFVSECCEMFIDQRKEVVSDITLRDYKYILRRLTLIYGDQPINEIRTSDMKEYIENYDNSGRKATHIYLRSFFQFCVGKDNPHSENGVGWIQNNPICWTIPKVEYNEPTVLSYDEIIDVLLRCSSIANRMNGMKRNNKPYCRNRNELVAYYIFRLFSLMRSSEFQRLVDIGGSDISKNKFFDYERDRIILSTEIYRKKGSINRFGVGRQITPLNETFKEWMNWIIEYKIPLNFPNGRYGELELREVCKDKKMDSSGRTIKGLNVLRHTAITYHLLNFKESILTSKIAGTSLGMIERHYLSKNIPTLDSEKLYSLTPTKAKELAIIN